MRIFIAINLSKSARKEISKLLKELQRKHWKVKWEKAEKLHITLAFMGKIEQQEISKIKKVCQNSIKNIHPFTLKFKGLGCFPDYQWPRIVWLGTIGDLKNLALLQKNLYKELEKASFNIKKKPFSPHITLGRVKKARSGERREIGRQLKALQKLDFKSKIKVNKITIYQSILSRTGSAYKKLEEIFL